MSTSTPPPVAAAARATRADAVRNRARVLAAAREAFAEQGRDAQMDDVARRAGVGVGTVYRHFPTKTGLVDALAEQYWSEVVERLDAEALTAEDPWAAFVQMFVIAGEMHERDRVFAEFSSEARGGTPGPPAAFQTELDARAETLLARGHAAGVLRADLEIGDLYPIFCSLAAINRFSAGDWRRHLELVLAGLRAAPAGSGGPTG